MLSNEEPKKGGNKAYLEELYDGLARLKAEDQWVMFKIAEAGKTGFSIKVGGLFGFIAYQKMPWFYSDIKKWSIIAPYMVDCKFGGKIQRMSFDEDDLFIAMDASASTIKTPELEVNQGYRCIVVYKTEQNLLVELGYNFDWKCGSIEAWVPKSSFYFQEEFNDLNVGESFYTLFHGFDQDGKIILGHQWVHKDLKLGELEKLIGTVQPITIRRDTKHKYSFWYMGTYRCQMEITESIYSDRCHIEFIEQYISDLKDGNEILCEFISLSKGKYKVHVKLTDSLCKAISEMHSQEHNENKVETVTVIEPRRGQSKMEDWSDKKQWLNTLQELEVKIGGDGLKTYWLHGKYICMPHEMYTKVKPFKELKKKLRKCINTLVHRDKVWFAISDKMGKKNILYIHQTVESANKNLTDLKINKEINNTETIKTRVSDMRSESLPDELDSIMDTEQDIVIQRDSKGKRVYWFKDVFQCKKIRFFENYLDQINYINPLNRYIQGLEDGSIIRCIVTDVDTKKNKLHIVLSCVIP